MYYKKNKNSHIGWNFELQSKMNEFSIKCKILTLVLTPTFQLQTKLYMNYGYVAYQRG